MWAAMRGFEVVGVWGVWGGLAVLAVLEPRVVVAQNGTDDAGVIDDRVNDDDGDDGLGAAVIAAISIASVIGFVGLVGCVYLCVGTVKEEYHEVKMQSMRHLNVPPDAADGPPRHKSRDAASPDSRDATGEQKGPMQSRQQDKNQDGEGKTGQQRRLSNQGYLRPVK